jgi:hypothetical protein
MQGTTDWANDKPKSDVQPGAIPPMKTTPRKFLEIYISTWIAGGDRESGNTHWGNVEYV